MTSQKSLACIIPRTSELSFETQSSLRKKFKAFKLFFTWICNEKAFKIKNFMNKIILQLL